MLYEEANRLLENMKSRFNDGFSSKDRAIIDHLYFFIFGKEVTNKGCSDCYRDAYILIRTKLKTLGVMPTKSNYTLKAGAMIHPVGTSKFYTNPLPSDAVAEEFLSKFPEQIGIFASYPEDWEERVAFYVKNKSEKAEITEVADNSSVLAEIAEKNVEIAQLTEEKATLKAEIAEKNVEIAQLTEEKATLKAEIAEKNVDEELLAELTRVNEELTVLKAENKSLKAANTRLKNASKDESAE